MYFVHSIATAWEHQYHELMQQAGALVGVAVLVVAATAWKVACEWLRWRRAKLLEKLDAGKEYVAIHSRTLFVEFPFLYRCAFESGVMRSAGVPEIMAQLVKGGVFRRDMAKQYDDMDILVREMLLHPVDSPRGSLAIRRLNFLHSFYRIPNADYLYVLALHLVSFVEWTDRYGYRKLTELEKACHYKVWHDIGTRMGIRDIPPTIADLARYRDEYEAKHMRYADSNEKFAEAGVNLMLADVPKLLRPLVSRVLLSVFDDRLLAALGCPQPPAWIGCLARSVLMLHKLLVRWMPPRCLNHAETRIYPASSNICPILRNSDDQMCLPLSFHRFKPHYYENGYKIAELGGLKPGAIGKLYEATSS